MEIHPLSGSFDRKSGSETSSSSEPVEGGLAPWIFFIFPTEYV